MDALSGKNSTGRRVSLLNDGPPAPQLLRLNSITPSLPSRTSSYSTSPITSPPTPRLVRSDSSDSVTMQTPSPITPDFDFSASLGPAIDSPTFSQNGFFPHHKEVHTAYPPLPQPTGPLPYQHATPMPPQPIYQPHQQQQQPQRPLARPLEEPVAQNPKPKKNSYPCPMAKQFNCSDYFTTSGHAARHAKKHTGKKDAYCPECNKAFTRKDNMEQHRRTHQSGRNSAKSADRDVKKTKPAKRPRPSPLQANAMGLSPMPSTLDPALPASPAGSFQMAPMAPMAQPTDSFMDFTSHVPQRSPYGDPAAYAINGYNSASSYGGLDALAIAASGEKRKFES
ncbi:hypothetical protein ACN47E_008839 [Coniothyrium glycines]